MEIRVGRDRGYAVKTLATNLSRSSAVRNFSRSPHRRVETVLLASRSFSVGDDGSRLGGWPFEPSGWGPIQAVDSLGMNLHIRLFYYFVKPFQRPILRVSKDAKL